MHSIATLFAAITTLLAPRASDGRMGQGAESNAGAEVKAHEPGGVHPLERTSFGQFILHELRPFSEELLGSQDIGALERCLDEFIDGDLGDRLFAQGQTLISDGWGDDESGGLTDEVVNELVPSLEALRKRMVAVLGSHHAEHVDEGLSMMLSVATQVPIPVQSAGVEAVVDAAEPIRLSEILSDVDVPLERRQVALAGMESSACLFALLHLVADQRTVTPWLADELIKRWIFGQAAVLRQLHINDDALALARQESAHIHVNGHYEQLARRGAAEGVDVWPPEVGNDD